MNISPLILALLGELLLVTAVMSIFLVTGALRRKSRDHASALALIGQIKDKEELRLEETRALASRISGASDTEADELAISIQNGELAHYQLLVDSYIKRDAVAFQGVCESFEAATDPYRKMGHAQESTSEDVEVQIVDPGELEILREEKACLAEELKITMDTMGRMLSEYACMYAGGGAVEELDKESIANMYSADEADFGQGDNDVAEDTASSGKSKAAAVTPSDDADIAALDQEWLEEAVKAAESEASPDADSADEDMTVAMDPAQFPDDLVSLDLESGKGR